MVIFLCYCRIIAHISSALYGEYIRTLRLLYPFNTINAKPIDIWSLYGGKTRFIEHMKHIAEMSTILNMKLVGPLF